MNKIYLTGRLCGDPELRKTPSGIDVCNFRMAVQRPGTKKEDKLTDYFSCTVWGSKDGPGRAGVIQKYFHKGDGIVLSGPMTTKEYTDNDGKKRTNYSVQVDDFEFPMGKRSDTTANHEPSVPSGAVPVDEKEPLPF